MSVREDFKKWLETQPKERVKKVYRIALTLQDVEDEEDERKEGEQDPLVRALDEAPEDDEVITEKEKEVVQKAREEVQRGEVHPWEDVKKELHHE